jgi:predicted Zn-dependent peptidase
MAVATTTPDGLTILVEELPYTHSVSIGCFVRVGACDEPAELSGIAHAIEHMCFKGTRDFPSARLISEAVEGVGGIMNASTSYENTVYWCKVADVHFSRALEVLANLLRFPRFDAGELAKERRVIIEEIRGLQDSPADWVHELVQESLWGSQPLGRDIAGSVESVAGLRRADLLNFWERYYRLDRMVISLAGNIRADAAIDAVTTAFAGHSAAGTAGRAMVTTSQPGPHLRLLNRESEQGNFCLALPGISYYDPERRALQVLDTIVGGGMSSRLFQELREEQGLAYNVGSYYSEYATTGSWAIFGSVETASLCDCLAATFEILRSIAAEGITAAELNLVQEQVKGGMLLSLEDSWSQASRNASLWMRHGSIRSVEQVVSEIEAVTLDDVQRMARRLLRRDDLHLAVIGPYDADDAHELQALLAEGLDA